tara:strand:+ start:165 stop:1187 length:1023 start_codon:yes stop_codon:yes gene_type:complete
MSLFFPKSSYLVTPLYDWIAFIGAPLIALLFGILVNNQLITNSLTNKTIVIIIVGSLFALSQSHLLITIVRAYGNQEIFSKFKKRLVIGPLIIFIGMYSFESFFLIMLFLATWWDVYHSACQTYGFTRLYDVKVGNKSLSMRVQDRVLNCLIYIGPLIGSANLLPHLKELESDFFQTIFLGSVPFYANEYSMYILMGVLLFSAFFFPYYVFCYLKQTQHSPISYQKITILIITTLVSIIAWGFCSFGTAMMIVNLFHAWQYYGMIYWSEKPAISKRFSLTNQQGKIIIISILTGITIVFMVGKYFYKSMGFEIGTYIYLTISTCHFWFDGFIWSVKKKHI